MQNWDLAQKYAQISENAYGTATEKMKAFTDSIEAARNRVTNAIEGLTLDLNASTLMKDFYSMIAYVIENLDKLGGTIAAVALLGNYKNIAQAAISGGSFVAGKLTGWEAFLSNISPGGNLGKGWGKSAFQSAGKVIDDMWLQNQIKVYGDALAKRAISLTIEEREAAVALQNRILESQGIEREIQLQFLSGQIDETIYKQKVEDLKIQGKISEAKYQELMATKRYTQALENGSAQLIVNNEKKISSAPKNQAIFSAATGLGSLLGGGLGMYGGFGVGEFLGSGLGTVGTILGSLIGGKAGIVVGSGMANY